MTRMHLRPESWLKIGLPGFPVAFTIFGVWLYWGDNPLPLLAPPLAFWGLVILLYLFSHFEVDSTAGDVVQLVRTLPRRWLESYTVTAPSRTIPDIPAIVFKHLHTSAAFRTKLAPLLMLAPVLNMYWFR
jgi:hypothetical protein